MFLLLFGPTNHVQTVDSVMLYIVGVSAILLLGVTAAMIYFVIKFNRKKGHKPKDIHGNVWLETLWIGIPTILVLTMFYYGYIGFMETRDVPDDAMVVRVTARMWQFKFEYLEGKTSDTLYVPLGKPIKLEMESVDVNHAFFVPAFRIKEDVVYGRKSYLYFKPEELGSYDVACAEYCGLNHSMMYTKVVVVPEPEFKKWLKKKDEPANETKKEEGKS